MFGGYVLAKHAASSAVKIAVIAAITVLFVILAVLGSVPSGTTNVKAKYQQISEQASPTLNWLDPYIFDYFRLQNDFSKVTDSEITSTVNRFVVRAKAKNPNWDPKNPLSPEYITRVTTRSLLDVMTAAGYTQEQYQMALQLEDLIQQTDMPVGDVTVAQLRYMDVNPQLLFSYVSERNSSFTFDDMHSLEDAAKTYDVNPLLLLAITGQEESFDPRNWPDAPRIHNNPWNVYHSWQDYNTTFADAANIAANTLRHKLSTPPPNGMDGIQWINSPQNPWGIYAEDTHWAFGVEDIFTNLMNFIGKPITK